MQLDAVSVEINILARKSRLRNERKVMIKEENSNSDVKLYFVAKTLERMVERLDNLDRKPQWDNQPHIRNPNFRKNNNPRKAKKVAPD